MSLLNLLRRELFEDDVEVMRWGERKVLQGVLLAHEVDLLRVRTVVDSRLRTGLTKVLFHLWLGMLHIHVESKHEVFDLMAKTLMRKSVG